MHRGLLGFALLQCWHALAPLWPGSEDFIALRSRSNPIIHAELPGLSELGEEGRNINGPSAIRVPNWIDVRLGQYYLYFASHTGSFIRLAYAPSVDGPWTVHPNGVLHLAQVPICHGHIASPDVVVEGRRVWLFFHCVVRQRAAIPLEWDSRSQCTAAVSSTDGLKFTGPGGPHRFLGPFYFRIFQHGPAVFALAKRRGAGGGVLYRCPHRSVADCANTPFIRGPQVVENMRHGAVVKASLKLLVFFSRVGDAPESIYVRTVDLRADWLQWGEQAGPDVLVLSPQERYEGAHLPVMASPSGPSKGEVCQLRDPAILLDGDRLLLFYAVAGEHGIAVALLKPKGNAEVVVNLGIVQGAQGHRRAKVIIRGDQTALQSSGMGRVGQPTDINSWWWWLQAPVGLTSIFIATTFIALCLLRTLGH